ncbi:MAG: hypothetical protein LAO21_20600 [Acidobacteriia bacterium]|nr:hypothetical protein [Terriglobia bacterium]
MDFEQAGKKLDEEVRKIVEYLETKAIPSARKDTSKFLRYASKQLEKLAENMDREQGKK